MSKVNFECNFCNKSYDTRRALILHLINKETGEHYDINNFEEATKYVNKWIDERITKASDNESIEQQSNDQNSGEIDVTNNPLVNDETNQNRIACPNCGGTNLFDASEFSQYEYGCADCTAKADEGNMFVFDE